MKFRKINITCIILSILFLFLAKISFQADITWAASSTIGGYVKNCSTGAGISGVTMSVYDDAKKQTVYPVTDASGHFTISGWASSGDWYAVRGPASPPNGFQTPIKTQQFGWTQNYCSSTDTPLNSTSYECQVAGLNDCAGNCSGTCGTERCNFCYSPIPIPPTCSGGYPQAPTTTQTTGTFYVYAQGVANANSVAFAVWSAAVGGNPPIAQDDIIWYTGVSQGGGTWRAAIDLSKHPGMGTIYSDIWMSNASYANTWCSTDARFTRVAVQPSSTPTVSVPTPTSAPTQTGVPSVEFQYHFNENATYGVPIAVKAIIHTQPNSSTDKTMETYDLYDGLGNKIQSQSNINGQVITTYGDQDDWSKTNPGLKTYTAENFVAPTFGQFTKTIPAGTKIAYSFANLSGQNWKSIDMNGNVSYSYSNPEDFTAKTVSPNGLITYAATDPIARTQTGSVCKDTQTVTSDTANSDNDFLNNKYQRSCPGSGAKISSKTVSDFMGNTTQVFDNLGITNGKALTSNFYDSLGRLRTNDYSSEDLDLGKSYVLEYDLNGNILRTKNAAETEYKTIYDALNRPSEKWAGGILRNHYYYDQNFGGKDCGTTPKGKLCGKEEWDNFGNKILTYYRYDELGRVLDERVNYAGTPGSILDQKFGNADFVTSYTYDNIDRVLTVKYPEFTGSGIPAETVTNTYTGPYLSTVK
ncbi:GBS Bsp-like repeat-containing protein, partial [Candidatus Microgenomates bacterium]|nr:GBS Bsp-like repeat-containing protein [Candidatus Microgenomates bacterium]